MSETEPEGTEPEGDAPETEAWAGPDQNTWEQTQATLQETQQQLQWLSQATQPVWQQQQGPPELEFDPLADNANEQLREILKNEIRQELAPYQEFVEAQRLREGNARAQDIIADDIAKNGDFVYAATAAQVQRMVGAYYADTIQQFPNDQRRAAESAYELAIQEARQWEKQVGEAYHQAKLNELSGLSGARRDQPVGTNGTQFDMPAGGSLIDVAYRHGNGRF